MWSQNKFLSHIAERNSILNAKSAGIVLSVKISDDFREINKLNRVFFYGNRSIWNLKMTPNMALSSYHRQENLDESFFKLSIHVRVCRKTYIFSLPRFLTLQSGRSSSKSPGCLARRHSLHPYLLCSYVWKAGTNIPIWHDGSKPHFQVGFCPQNLWS